MGSGHWACRLLGPSLPQWQAARRPLEVVRPVHLCCGLGRSALDSVLAWADLGATHPQPTWHRSVAERLQDGRGVHVRSSSWGVLHAPATAPRGVDRTPQITWFAYTTAVGITGSSSRTLSTIPSDAAYRP